MRRALLSGVVSFLLLAGCTRIDQVLSGGDRLTRFGISAHDRRGGVVQASPGIEETSVGAHGFSVPEGSSLLRFKLYDDPVPNSGTHGLLAITLEYDSLLDMVPEREAPDALRLRVLQVELKRKARREKGNRPWLRDRDSDLIVLQIPADKQELRVERGRAFAAVVRGVSVPPGDFEWARVVLDPRGVAEAGEADFRAIVADPAVKFSEGFRVEIGKITTLNMKQKDRRGRKERSAWRRHRHPDHRPPCQERRLVPVQLRADEVRSIVGAPPDKIFLSITQLRAQDHVLNDTPTTVELLELRDGAVALVGHNMVTAGHYSGFQLVVAGQHRVRTAEGEFPLQTADGSAQTVLELAGPFDLRGGRITEFFLDFDPNTSVFLTSNGYVLDPVLRVAGVQSMPPAAENRLVEALGPRANAVADRAAYMAICRVAQTFVDVSGGIPRTRVSFEIEDRLRGQFSGNNISLKVPGGVAGSLRLRVYGMPVFITGERAILFLNRIGEEYVVAGGEEGKVGVE